VRFIQRPTKHFKVDENWKQICTLRRIYENTPHTIGNYPFGHIYKSKTTSNFGQ